MHIVIEYLAMLEHVVEEADGDLDVVRSPLRVLRGAVRRRERKKKKREPCARVCVFVCVRIQ
jgi:nitrate reductase assembly molybdenum cofactor insertion protein NarJ